MDLSDPFFSDFSEASTDIDDPIQDEPSPGVVARRARAKLVLALVLGPCAAVVLIALGIIVFRGMVEPVSEWHHVVQLEPTSRTRASFPMRKLARRHPTASASSDTRALSR